MDGGLPRMEDRCHHLSISCGGLLATAAAGRHVTRNGAGSYHTDSIASSMLAFTGRQAPLVVPMLYQKKKPGWKSGLLCDITGFLGPFWKRRERDSNSR